MAERRANGEAGETIDNRAAMDILALPEDRVSEVLGIYDEFDRPNFPTPHDPVGILRKIRSQDGEIFVAIDALGKICGTYSIIICANLNHGGKPFAIVENVICTELKRRSGVGRMLMSHAKDYAIRHGSYTVYLQSSALKTENHQFYEACGFRNDKVGLRMKFD